MRVERQIQPADKRLTVVESELASVLQSMKREGNTISPVLRQAWDSGVLNIFNKNSPAQSSGAHISVIGHITVLELRRHMTETEMASGFANRFCIMFVDRSKLLPEGGRIPDERLKPLVAKLKEAVQFGARKMTISRDADARLLWHQKYRELSEGKPGLFGAVVSRAEAQVMRIACIYALLDLSPVIREPHFPKSSRDVAQSRNMRLLCQ